MEKIKVAIIGCGTIANSAHIPAYLDCPNAEIKYFCDIIPERAEKAVKDYGCGIAITDYHDACNDPEVTAVSICTPNNGHASISIDCMRAGKHVLCEKPAARTLTEVLEMQKVQHETGMTLNIGVVNRFNTAVNHIKRLIDDGELGEVYQVYGSFRAHRSIPGLGGPFTTKAIAGGGVLIDWGVHFLDLIMYCCGDPATKTVSAQTFSKLGTAMKDYTYVSMWSEISKDLNGTFDVDDAVTALIRTEGPVITINGAWAQNIGPGESYVDFLGDKAGVRLQYGGNFTIYGVKDGMLTEITPSYPTTDHFHNEINAFVDCIRTGEKLPSHIDTVVVTARMMQAIYDSAEAGREIVLD